MIHFNVCRKKRSLSKNLLWYECTSQRSQDVFHQVRCWKYSFNWSGFIGHMENIEFLDNLEKWKNHGIRKICQKAWKKHGKCFQNYLMPLKFYIDCFANIISTYIYVHNVLKQNIFRICLRCFSYTSWYIASLFC